MSAITEAARELRAAGFRTKVVKVEDGVMFGAVRQFAAGKVLVASWPDGAAIVGARNDVTGRPRVKFTDDLRAAASMGMQYAEVISR